MPKVRSTFVCNECGAEFSQHFGRCPSCSTWNSLEEQVSRPTTPPAAAQMTRLRGATKGRMQSDSPARAIASLKLNEISDTAQDRLGSGYVELDRVLGGGIVPGSLVLIGGDPGIGKSTLLLQTANRLATKYRTLYVCAEESGRQVKLRAQRLGVGKQGEATELLEPSEEQGSLHLLPEIDLDTILAELESLKPRVAIIDSIQALYYSALTSAPGSVSQVRECTSVLMQVAKRQNITLFIVGHVTKEGAIAGPKVLEHLVDTVLYFEGDRFASHRLLRSVKNRFGATHEIGVFEMVDQGLQEVLNPSELFLGSREEAATGTATIVACEGTRPIVVELQALVSATSYSSPRRSTTGIEYNRLLQILAVLEKRVGIPLSKLDAYVASSGGLNVGEPAADLGVAVAVAASFRDRIVDPYTVLIGEVGLGGQVRPVSQTELRLKEAAKLGFKKAIVPKGASYGDVGMEVIPVSRVLDAISVALAGSRARQQEEHEIEREDVVE
ncbi:MULTISPECIES: DNA repair protein RadA [Leptolyngbya]|jgi:DNA repair protein RadA/Sms|uniref:DNA repair protein RadA n=1 Tax=Leptolyngbya boryana NIES-2135 TaxID=1973484 RepID=A0A1Z4JAL4_LEPBY|nr:MULTISPECIES: DNA repair protein RadA [Leptolyngbya]BAY53819.1 DNA repair protein RadA [Leptolyngbya boryana NIES-2135]MBD2367742.1 DNA repair protein RadA [Leptolyngbya sp. FACHB-161]MBD2374410.1 DNA repair protein RadA [Leptolyngbya sp. FACHB-238]MBD2398632.1 DNA repair protein RadA [Leptolyngbya sp. FACHB-239]MBD2406334.1 DNA repair protein RadA [Leptolyngbya sp. FACHB-402]